MTVDSKRHRTLYWQLCMQGAPHLNGYLRRRVPTSSATYRSRRGMRGAGAVPLPSSSTCYAASAAASACGLRNAFQPSQIKIAAATTKTKAMMPTMIEAAAARPVAALGRLTKKLV